MVPMLRQLPEHPGPPLERFAGGKGWILSRGDERHFGMCQGDPGCNIMHYIYIVLHDIMHNKNCICNPKIV